jgi:hypothetical protein
MEIAVDDPLHDELSAACELFGNSHGQRKVRTLQRWRKEGIGPNFLKIGHTVRYRQSVLDAYKRSCERASTSASAPPAADRSAA